MARKEKTVIGEENNIPAQRQFTDREEPQESFIHALNNLLNKEYSVLVYYGVGGIGKSSLQKHLKEFHLDQDDQSVYSWIDFEIEANRTAQKTLRGLAEHFKSKFKMKFPIFDMAYLIYWSKAFPDHDIKKEGLPFLEEGNQLSEIISTFVNSAGILGTTLNTLDYIYKKSKEFTFDSKIKQALADLTQLESNEIEAKLSVFFAQDLESYQNKYPNKKIVIFFDTYEALWPTHRNEAYYFAQDEWLRDIITELPHILFVICGREKIRWTEIEEEWEDDLNQHILGSLSQTDSQSFLKSCHITDLKIQNSIIQSSEGFPYYLDLCVDIYYQIKSHSKVPSQEDFIDIGQQDIFKKFMKYLNHSEQETLKVLANARFFTKELFINLIAHFKTGYPATAIKQLSNFSFISQDTGKYFIHDLMRKSLHRFSDDELTKEVHEFLFQHYNKQLEALNIKSISYSENDALQEAFYHKLHSGTIEELFLWYTTLYSTFKQAAKYKFLLTSSHQLVDLLIEEFGEYNSYTATAYNDLAWLYFSMDDFNNALPLYTKALQIRINIFGERHPDTATTYSDLAWLHKRKGDFRSSHSLFEKALEIRKKILGETHPSTAKSYNNLAGNYSVLNQFDKALLLYQKSLKIIEDSLGSSHYDTAIAYSNFASFYKHHKHYSDALPLYEKALEIYINTVGNKHPNTAKVYNSLADIYRLQENYPDAIQNYKITLSIREDYFGKEHFKTAETYHMLAWLYSILDDNHSALELYKTALAIRRNQLGEMHTDTADTYNNLAAVYHTLQDFNAAIPLYKKAIEINQTLLGEKHPSTIRSYENLTLLYNSLGNN